LYRINAIDVIFYVDVISACSLTNFIAQQHVVFDQKPITSPLYPDYYPINERKHWVVTAPTDNVVAFMFVAFNISTLDSVRVKNHKNQTLVSSDDSPKLNYWWTSSAREIRIEFYSSKIDTCSLSCRGFELKIKFVKVPKGKDLHQVSKLVVTFVLFNAKNVFVIKTLIATLLILLPLFCCWAWKEM